MKHILTAIFAIALIPLAACSNSGAVKEVRGYPVFDLFETRGIDATAFKADEAEIRKQVGKNYNAYTKQHQLFVSRGYDLHTPLRIQLETGREMDVFVRTKDYESLWKRGSVDPQKPQKSYLVCIKYIEDTVGGVPVNRATAFASEVVERELIIR
jgi:hypothetical protein